jgi:inner membrane protein
VALQAVLTTRLREAWPQAERLQVFPAWLSLSTWRFVVVNGGGYAAGTVRLGESPSAPSLLHAPTQDALPAAVRAVPTVREALAWARFPVVSTAPREDGGMQVRVGDLRYHLEGRLTLEFVVELGPDLSVKEARLERGGSARELFERWRGRKD